MDKGDIQTAEKYLEKTLELNHSSGNFLDSYGELMYKKGNYDECRRYMGAAIAQGKKTEASWLENSYYYRGLANKKLGFDADAYDDLSRAVEFNDEDAEKALNTLFTSNNQKSGKYFNMYRSPSSWSNKSEGLRLIAIETTEESTILYFELNNGGWCNISKDTYIIEKRSKIKLYIIDAEGIAFAPEKTYCNDNFVSFTLTFPPISERCHEIDFVEDEGKGFQMTGIVLKDNH